MLYSAVDTSGTRGIGEMLDDLLQVVGSSPDVDANIKSLVQDTHKYYSDGLFDDNYDNISRTAPELKESLIYQYGSNVGSSVNQKSIGDALRRCLYATNSTYHAMALLPESNKAILLTKCQASMARDEKTRNKTDIGEPCELQQYLVIIELIYKPSDDIEDGHNFGIFVEVGRHYCTRCIAGQGKCRHKGERLWYQYHHWTDERFGIDRPTTIDACSWHPGGKPLECAVRSKIHAQQTVKHELSIEEQTKKIKRGVKRDSTEGDSCEYVPHMDSRKMNPSSSLQFSKERTAELFRLLREQS